MVETLDEIAVKNLMEAYRHNLAPLLLPVLESVLKLKDKSQITILWAAENGFADLIEILIDYKRCDINECNGSGQTALHLAACGGHQRVVKLLLKRGKDLGLKVKQAKDHTSWTPVHFAARIGHVGIIDTLVTEGGAEVDTQTAHFGRTPLHYASQEGHAAAIQILLDHGANIHARTFDTGEMALHLAAKSAQPAAVAALLWNGSCLNSQCTDGMTALHYAVSYDFRITDTALVNDSMFVVRYLLENGADIDILDNEGQTVLHYAILGYVEVVEMLLEKGAAMDIKNDAGFTAYQLAMRTGRPDMKNLMHFGHKDGENPPGRGGQ